MLAVGIFAFLCFAGANGQMIHPNGQGTPTTVVKAMNEETVMQSGPPITPPEQSRQNQNQFVRDPTIFNPKRSRFNSVQNNPTNAMVNDIVQMMNSMAPGTNRQEEKPSMSERSNMMMNMIKNMPNMASIIGDRKAMTDLMNAMSSAPEIMAKMQTSMKMNQARKSNVQSPYETDYYMPTMMNKMTNMNTMASKGMMTNAPSMATAAEMMINMPSMPTATKMMLNMPNMPPVAEMMTNMPNMPSVAELIKQNGQKSNFMSRIAQGPSNNNMMEFTPQRSSKYRASIYYDYCI
ncbi:uncharacterized protein LOC134254493 [Saccostrea cucullata]|uniref:uncharacterized protein LOC134254493 n=1 Tax=Saccostrea cuccullata TaxID=36930 RepID=UPI002ED1FDB1